MKQSTIAKQAHENSGFTAPNAMMPLRIDQLDTVSGGVIPIIVAALAVAQGGALAAVGIWLSK